MLEYLRNKGKGTEKQPAAAAAAAGQKSKEDEEEDDRVLADAAAAEEGHAEPHKGPVLDDADQAFLERIVSEEGSPPPLPERPRTRDAVESEAVAIAEKDKNKDSKRKSNPFAWLRRSSSRSVSPSKRADKSNSLATTTTTTSKHGHSQNLTVPGQTDGTDEGQAIELGDKKGKGEKKEEEEEDEEMASVLERLNLAAENNRIFSVSDESKELLKKFNLVLQDLVNGVPTAYHDLESLLTNSDSQIQKTYKSLPPFLQELIEKLPEKVTGKLGDGFLASGATAAAVEAEEGNNKKKKASSSSSKSKQYLATGASAAGKLLKNRIPSLKELVTKQGSAVALLRSIVAALRTRFPALMGASAVWSVALFVLLFVFWYCHKRGRETRLERERAVTEREMDELRRRVAADPAWIPPPGWDAEGGPNLTTRAPEGASIDEVRAGMYDSPDVEEPPEADEEEGRAGYAPGGSLAKAIDNKEFREEKKK